MTGSAIRVMSTVVRPLGFPRAGARHPGFLALFRMRGHKSHVPLANVPGHCEGLSVRRAQPAFNLSHSGLVVVFAASGFILASWGARLPALRGAAGLAPEFIGLVVGFMGAGSTVALLLAAPIARALGDLRTIRWSAWLSSVVLLLGAAFSSSGALLMVAAAGLGFGNVVCDVAMNAHATRLQGRERSRGMARLHGWFSVGALAGAGTAALLTHAGVPLPVHLVLIAVGTAAVIEVALTPVRPAFPVIRRPAGWREVVPRFGPWRDRRTWSLGCLALGAVFAEGAANEWLTTALTDDSGFALTQAQAAGALAVFALGMVVMRLPLGRYTREASRGAALALSLILVAAGTGAVIAASLADAGAGTVAGAGAGAGAGVGRLAVALVGLFLWGAGAALGVPFALAAAGKSSKERGRAPEHSETSERVSVVQTVGFGSLIVAAPALSLLGKELGFIWILAAAPAVMALGFVLSALLHQRGTHFTTQARRQSRQLAHQTFRLTP